jgi:hypothetical protein
MNPIETKGRGKTGCKSANVTAMLKRGTLMGVMPNGKQTKEQKQEARKKLQTDMNKGLEVYFGAGKRIPTPSKDGKPISTVVQTREGRGNTPSKNSTNKVVLNTGKDGEGDNGNTVRSTPGTKKGTKSPRNESAHNEEHQNKKTQVRQQRIWRRGKQTREEGLRGKRGRTGRLWGGLRIDEHVDEEEGVQDPSFQEEGSHKDKGG